MWISLLTGGCVALLLGKELGWDLAHYHFYGPYAFLTQRQQMDFWPTSYIHQYLNPFIDVLPYYMIQSLSPPLTIFLLGAMHGINFWLLYLISTFFIRHNIMVSLFISLLGLYGPTVLPGLGSFQNDNLLTLFALSFVYLQLRSLPLPNNLIYFFSAFVLGMGIGLKPTAGIFISGGIVATLFQAISLQTRLKKIFLLSAGISLGMLLTGGYWMWHLWSQFHNPVFPFFNHIFQSAQFNSANWFDNRFYPKNILQELFFPYFFAWDGRTADQFFCDFRFLIIHLLFCVLAIKWIALRMKEKKNLHFTAAQLWLCTFFIFTYLAWQYFFSIARYLATLEMLAPLIIYLLITLIIEKREIRTLLLALIFYTLAFFMQPIYIARSHHIGDSFFNIQLPNTITPTSTGNVLMSFTAYSHDAAPPPQIYLIPAFPRSWRFIGIPIFNHALLKDAALESKLNELNQQAGPFYLLTTENFLPTFYRIVSSFKFVPDGRCENIFSDRQRITQQQVVLCPLKKLPIEWYRENN